MPKQMVVVMAVGISSNVLKEDRVKSSAMIDEAFALGVNIYNCLHATIVVADMLLYIC